MTALPSTPAAHRSIYTGSATNWPMVVATSAGALLLVVMSRGAGASWTGIAIPLGLVVLGAVANALTASSVRATAGPNGFTIHWGFVGWPRCSYALDEIERAEVIDLAWWWVSYGFWWTPKRTCCTVRSGPTLRLTLSNGRTVTVTVPQPDTAVAALNEALAAR